MYFNYHAKAQRLIREGKLIEARVCDDWNSIRPALVLIFRDAPPMPIRPHRWKEYEALLADVGNTAHPADPPSR